MSSQSYSNVVFSQSSSKFYAFSMVTSLTIDNIGTTKTLSSINQGVIWSSDQTESCYILYNLPAIIATPAQSAGLVSDLSSVTYLASQSTAISISSPYTGADSFDLLENLFTNIDSWCTFSSSIDRAALTPVTQAKTTFTYSIGTAATFPITAYQASITCGSPSLTFTYSAYKPDTTALESFFSVSSSTGSITATSASTAGTFQIVIVGELATGKIETSVFTLIGNYPPTFSSSSFADITVSVYGTIKVPIPTIID